MTVNSRFFMRYILIDFFSILTKIKEVAHGELAEW